MDRRSWVLLPHGLCLVAAAWLLLITPTLNADDLQIAMWAAASLSEGWGKTLTTVLFNMDLGVSQPRTYGLARTIQYMQSGLFGTAPMPAYAGIIALHSASGVLVYRIIRKIGGDKLSCTFAVIAWIASPAVLPLLKVQHFFLYLIAPYYPLLGWVLLTVARQQTVQVFLAGACLLTAAWLLGEGVIVPVFAVVMTFALYSGSWRRAIPLIGQGAVAGLLLLCYLGYQHAFIRDPNVSQRFSLAPDVGLIGPFLQQLGQNARAVIGLSHYDAELGVLGGLDVFGGFLFWAVAAVLIASGAVATRFAPRSMEVHDRRLAVILALTCISSLGVYLLFTVAGVGVFATRYSAAFFALMPVAVIAVLSAYAPRTAAQLSASVIAAVSLALSFSLLYRAELLVSEPNRVRFEELQNRVVVLRPDSEFDLNPAVFGGLSGLRAITENGLADPLRFLWTSDLALRHYSSAILGNECRLVSDDKAELFLLGQSRGVFPLRRFVVQGSKLTPHQACELNPSAKADSASQQELQSGVRAIESRIIGTVDALSKVEPTAEFRYFMHPLIGKEASIEIDTSALASMTLSPRISHLNAECLADPTAGIVQMSYAMDGATPSTVIVDRNYNELIPLDLRLSKRLKVSVNQGNEVVTCDWFGLGVLRVVPR